MAKQIMFDDDARQKVRDGIQKLAKTVRVTQIGRASCRERV